MRDKLSINNIKYNGDSNKTTGILSCDNENVSYSNDNFNLDIPVNDIKSVDFTPSFNRKGDFYISILMTISMGIAIFFSLFTIQWLHIGNLAMSWSFIYLTTVFIVVTLVIAMFKQFLSAKLVIETHERNYIFYFNFLDNLYNSIYSSNE